jgi:hypothetical protein
VAEVVAKVAPGDATRRAIEAVLLVNSEAPKKDKKREQNKMQWVNETNGITPDIRPNWFGQQQLIPPDLFFCLTKLLVFKALCNEVSSRAHATLWILWIKSWNVCSGSPWFFSTG